jgi:electron transfer flavoprotein alpha subunit
MKVLVFVENSNGKATKAGLEAVSYAKALGADVTAVMFGKVDGDGGVGECGATTLKVQADNGDSRAVAKAIAAEASEGNYQLLIASQDNLGKEVMPRVAVMNGYSLISGVTELANVANGCLVKRNVFSGKAIAEVSSASAISILTVLPNSFGVKKVGGSANLVAMNGQLEAAQVKLIEIKGNHADAGIPLPEADLVVSAGRGMKGPENWGMVEELASLLGAATACSRPVSDIGWRPHHEHVGQTGIAIRPNLYIAIGISGAIQHLAGVNGSKVIVVINKDPEAPFFKAADYGIVGDAFEVLPRLIDAAKQFNANK